MSEIVGVLHREFVYVWYYFLLQLRQIAGYWILGMVVGSLVSVFAKDTIHGAFNLTISKNAAVDIYRKKNVQIHREVSMDGLVEDVPMTYMETDLENGVLDILKNLPEKYRDIFLLKYSSCLENSEIASLCGIQEGTVRQRISRGKIMIEEALKKREEYNGKSVREVKNEKYGYFKFVGTFKYQR